MAERMSADGHNTIHNGLVAYQDNEGVYVRRSHCTGTTFILFKDLI